MERTAEVRSLMPSSAISSRSPQEPIHVLIADDDPEFRSVISLAVRYLGHSCAVARDGEEAWQMHQAKRADVILSDWGMPTMDGLQLCRSVRAAEPLQPYTHFILLTAQDDKAHFVEGMRAGADEYITKPVDIDELQARLLAARRVMLVRHQLEARNSVLRRDGARDFLAARTDPLTSVSNRLRLREDLDALEERAARYGHRYCAALCDIDWFKSYNDCFGHLSGDDVLRRVATVIREHLRSGDGFYRYGGEEFLAILPEQSLADAAAGMGRVRQEVERLAIAHAPAAGAAFVTVSVGIAELGAEPIDSWLRRADVALYAAKARGRNRVEVEQPE